MNIIITALPHAGKTTCARKLCAVLKKKNIPIGGILCIDDDIIDIETDDTRKFLYKSKISNSQKIGPYHIPNKSIKFGENAIDSSVKKNKYTIIDEYGYLETRDKLGFHKITKKVLSSNKCIIIVRNLNLDVFLKRFKKYKFRVFELTKQNRNFLHKDIFEFIEKSNIKEKASKIINLEIKKKIWLEYNNKPIIGEGRFLLLKNIDKTKSIKKAALICNMSEKTAHNYIKKMEQRTGHKIIITKKGGKRAGAITEITDTGKFLIKEYERANCQ